MKCGQNVSKVVSEHQLAPKPWPIYPLRGVDISGLSFDQHTTNDISDNSSKLATNREVHESRLLVDSPASSTQNIRDFRMPTVSHEESSTPIQDSNIKINATNLQSPHHSSSMAVSNSGTGREGMQIAQNPSTCDGTRKLDSSPATVSCGESILSCLPWRRKRAALGSTRHEVRQQRVDAATLAAAAFDPRPTLPIEGSSCNTASICRECNCGQIMAGLAARVEALELSLHSLLAEQAELREHIRGNGELGESTGAGVGVRSAIIGEEGLAGRVEALEEAQRTLVSRRAAAIEALGAGCARSPFPPVLSQRRWVGASCCRSLYRPCLPVLQGRLCESGAWSDEHARAHARAHAACTRSTLLSRAACAALRLPHVT